MNRTKQSETDEFYEFVEQSLRTQQFSSVKQPEFAVHKDTDIIQIKHLSTGLTWVFTKIHGNWKVEVKNYIICPALAGRSLDRLHLLADRLFKRELEKL